MINIEELISDLTKKFEKELHQSVIDFLTEDYKRVLNLVVEEIKLMDARDNSDSQYSDVCNECSKHMCDACGCGMSESKSDQEEYGMYGITDQEDFDSKCEELTKEQMKNVVEFLRIEILKALKVERIMTKTEAKKKRVWKCFTWM